jgi:hypothetical protein
LEKNRKKTEKTKRKKEKTTIKTLTITLIIAIMITPLLINMQTTATPTQTTNSEKNTTYHTPLALIPIYPTGSAKLYFLPTGDPQNIAIDPTLQTQLLLCQNIISQYASEPSYWNNPTNHIWLENGTGNLPDMITLYFWETVIYLKIGDIPHAAQSYGLMSHYFLDAWNPFHVKNMTCPEAAVYESWLDQSIHVLALSLSSILQIQGYAPRKIEANIQIYAVASCLTSRLNYPLFQSAIAQNDTTTLHYYSLTLHLLPAVQGLTDLLFTAADLAGYNSLQQQVNRYGDFLILIFGISFIFLFATQFYHRIKHIRKTPGILGET